MFSIVLYPSINKGIYLINRNFIDGVMVSVLASSAVDCGIKTRSSQIKDYKIGICCFSVKNAVLGSKRKDWWARNHVYMSERNDISTRELLLQWASNIKIQLSVLVKYKPDIIIISSNVACSRQDIAVKMLFDVKQHSLTNELD